MISHQRKILIVGWPYIIAELVFYGVIEHRKIWGQLHIGVDGLLFSAAVTSNSLIMFIGQKFYHAKTWNSILWGADRVYYFDYDGSCNDYRNEILNLVDKSVFTEFNVSEAHDAYQALRNVVKSSDEYLEKLKDTCFYVVCGRCCKAILRDLLLIPGFVNPSDSDPSQSIEDIDLSALASIDFSPYGNDIEGIEALGVHAAKILNSKANKSADCNGRPESDFQTSSKETNRAKHFWSKWFRRI